MDSTLVIIISGIVGIAVGFAVAKIMERSNVSNLIKNAKKEAASILKDAKAEAETNKQHKILQAKEKFIELKAEHEQVILARDKKIAEAEKRTRDKESQVSNELAKTKKATEDLEAKINDYSNRIETLEKRQAEVDRLHKSQPVAKVVTTPRLSTSARCPPVTRSSMRAISFRPPYFAALLSSAPYPSRWYFARIGYSLEEFFSHSVAVSSCPAK